MRADIKQRLHVSHQAATTTINRARQLIFWRGMNSEIKDFINKCDVCNTFTNKQQKEPMLSDDIPARPWQKVGCDIFQLHNKQYLVLVDYYSNFFEINLLKNIGKLGVVDIMREHFARYGIPNTLISDNGPQFTSEVFANFASKYEFVHNTSSPYHQQANGKAENAVKTVKHILEKAKKDNQDSYLALLEWRNTPSSGMTTSPEKKNDEQKNTNNTAYPLPSS